MNRAVLFAVCVVFVCSCAGTEIFSDMIHTGRQSYRVIGQIHCNGKVETDIKIKLVDEDFGPDPDDLLGDTYPDAAGNFTVFGDTFEGTTIDPFLKIYHDCNDGIHPCQRRWKFELPNKYISDSKTPTKTLDFGIWNLEAQMPDEEHDCIH